MVPTAGRWTCWGVILLLLGTGVAVRADEVRLTPSISVREEYNDNVEFSRNSRVEDWITRVSPQLEWVRRSERTEIRLDGRMDAYAHADQDAYNRQGYRVGGSLGQRVTERLDISVDARLLSDKQIGDLDPATGIVTGNADRTDWTAAVAANYRLDEISNLSFKYSQGAEDYASSLYSDYVRHDLSGTYTRDIGDLWETAVAQVNAGFARYDYQTSQTETYYMSAGASKSLTETVSLTAVAGGRFSRQEYLESRLVPVTFFGFVVGYTTELYEAGTDQWSYIGQLILDHRRETGSEQVRLVRDIQAASGRSGTTENTRISLDVNHRFTEELTALLSAAYYFNTAESRDSYRRIDEQTFEIHPRLRYTWDRDWSFEVGYRFTREDDDAAATRIDRNQIFFLVRYQHPLFD